MSSLKLIYNKITSWEYWPFSVLYFPVFFYWLYLSVRARSLFFFSAANPSIETGGMLGESKYEILKKIPERYLPKTIFFTPLDSLEDVISKMNSKEIFFPVIAKPDVGQRGINVEKICTVDELKKYLSGNKVNFLIQEFIDYPFEAGVFYFRHPDRETGVVSSVVVKEFLQVTGDGSSTISQLIERYPRAAFQKERLAEKNPELMKYIPRKKEKILLEPIGNHCRGTKFLNGNHIIDEKLFQVFDELSKNIEGFFYGRFDLKCTSIEDLRKGINIRIMELNGVGSEPAHIYQPGFSIREAYRVLFFHWKQLFEISRKNRKLGVEYMSLSEAWSKYRWIKKYNKLLAGL